MKIFLYIASSLDGYIASPDGSIDWLTSTPPSKYGDYGYSELLNTIDTIIMGRKTYEDLINFDMDWPYADFRNYVVTTNPFMIIKSPNTELITGDIAKTIDELRSTSKKNIWLVGGSELLSYFLNHQLIDKITLSIIPIILGDGIPLFSKIQNQSSLQLVDSKSFETGVVNLTYHIKY
jgi:dihydrofolate reductase